MSTELAKISTTDFAALLGVSAEELHAEYERQGRPERFEVPETWVKNGRRRSKEYQAATGRNDMSGAIAHYSDRKS